MCSARSDIILKRVSLRFFTYHVHAAPAFQSSRKCACAFVVGVLDGGRESSSELGCAVAKRVSEAAFGIWAVRGDDGDLECFHHPSKGFHT